MASGRTNGHRREMVDAQPDVAKTGTVNVQVAGELHMALELYVAASDRTKKDVVAAALEAYLPPELLESVRDYQAGRTQAVNVVVSP